MRIMTMPSGVRGAWCERRDSNPHGGYPLEPKSSASTNSATFAGPGDCTAPRPALGHHDPGTRRSAPGRLSSDRKEKRPAGPGVFGIGGPSRFEPRRRISKPPRPANAPQRARTPELRQKRKTPGGAGRFRDWWAVKDSNRAAVYPSHHDPRTRRSAPGRLSFDRKEKRPAGPGVFGIGGPSRIRTLDLLIKSQLLYQLS